MSSDKLGAQTMELTWSAVMALGDAGDSERDEAQLIAGSRRGDERAFAELVRRHQQRVFRLANRFFRQRHEVEDVAQETFLTVWRKLSTYRARAPFEHWLTRVCLNTCYQRLRKQRPETEIFADSLRSPQADPDARLEVANLLKRLEPADRFVLQLLHGEEWSVAEIAERMGWSRSNVKVRAHRARKRLRRLLEEGVAG